MSEYIRQNKRTRVIRFDQNFYNSRYYRRIFAHIPKVLVVSSLFNVPSYLPRNSKVLVLNYFIPFKLDMPDIEYAKQVFSSGNVFYIGNSLYERDKIFKSFHFPKDNFRIMGSPRREYLIKNKKGIDIQRVFSDKL